MEEALNLEDETLDEEDLNLVGMIVYVKDRYNVSGSAYYKMDKICHQMPRH